MNIKRCVFSPTSFFSADIHNLPNVIVDIVLEFISNTNLDFSFCAVITLFLDASGSRGALGALMTCLRAARAQGVAPSSEKGLWGQLVPLSLLQQALVHKHDQVSVSYQCSTLSRLRLRVNLINFILIATSEMQEVKTFFYCL